MINDLLVDDNNSFIIIYYINCHLKKNDTHRKKSEKDKKYTNGECSITFALRKF